MPHNPISFDTIKTTTFYPRKIFNAAQNAAQKAASLLTKCSHKDKDGFTPLMRAARTNNLKEVKLLSKKGVADKDAKNNAGDTALIIAANNGYTDVVKVLLQHDADEDAENNAGDTALIIAANNDHTDVVKVLLQHDADMSKKNHENKRALDIVAEKCNMELVNSFLAKNPNQNILVDALHYAVKTNSKNTKIQAEVVKALCEKMHEDINNITFQFNTPLMLAASNGNLDVVNTLLQLGANPYISSLRSSDTALSIAVKGKHTNIAKAILDNKRFPSAQHIYEIRQALSIAVKNNTQDLIDMLCAELKRDQPSLNKALVDAAITGNEKFVKILLEAGAKVDQANKDGLTPLMFAAKNGHKNVVEILLEAGANDLHKALVAAVKNNHKNVVEFLCNKNPNELNEALGDAARQANKNVVDFLSELMTPQGVNETIAKREFWKTGINKSFFDAAENGHEKIIAFLFEISSEIVPKRYDAQEYQSLLAEIGLSRAAKNGHKNVVELLLDKGANDITITEALGAAVKNNHKDVVEFLCKTKELNEVLVDAVKNNHKDVVEFLCNEKPNQLNKALGAAAGQVNKNVVNFLSEVMAQGVDKSFWDAAENGHEKIVAFLFEISSEIVSKNYEVETALKVAAKNGHKNVVELLLDKGANDITITEALVAAVKNNHKDVVDLLCKNKELNEVLVDVIAFLRNNRDQEFQRVLKFLLKNTIKEANSSDEDLKAELNGQQCHLSLDDYNPQCEYLLVNKQIYELDGYINYLEHPNTMLNLTKEEKGVSVPHAKIIVPFDEYSFISKNF